MKKLTILINIFTLLAIVNGHGWLAEPPQRCFDPDPSNTVSFGPEYKSGVGGRGLPVKWYFGEYFFYFQKKICILNLVFLDVAQQNSNPMEDRFFYDGKMC